MEVVTQQEEEGSDGITAPSSRWEELVELEWERVELFGPAILAEGPEVGPPWHAPVFLRCLHVIRVVQHNRDDECHRHIRCEDRVNYVVKLQSDPIPSR